MDWATGEPVACNASNRIASLGWRAGEPRSDFDMRARTWPINVIATTMQFTARTVGAVPAVIGVGVQTGARSRRVSCVGLSPRQRADKQADDPPRQNCGS